MIITFGSRKGPNLAKEFAAWCQCHCGAFLWKTFYAGGILLGTKVHITVLIYDYQSLPTYCYLEFWGVSSLGVIINRVWCWGEVGVSDSI